MIADLNPVLRGWSAYFRTRNAAKRFNQLDSYVWRRLRRYLGLVRLRGSVQYPETAFWRQEIA